MPDDAVAAALAWIYRTCRKCGITKGLDKFYQSKDGLLGRRSTCKACLIAATLAYQRAHPEKKKVHAARYRERKPEVGAAQKRRYREANRAVMQDKQRQYRASDRRKDAARCQARRAIASGRLAKSVLCQGCGKTGRLEISHNDYDKPLEVEFLCVTCHRRKDTANARS